jgi:hypothetical protein
MNKDLCMIYCGIIYAIILQRYYNKLAKRTENCCAFQHIVV